MRMILLYGLISACSSTPVGCKPEEQSYFAPGCNEPATLRCRPAAARSAENAFCGCDGKTIHTAEFEVPPDLRYAFEGSCDVTPILRHEPDGRSPRQVFTLVVDHSAPVLGVFESCAPDPPKPAELGHVRCQDGAALVSISVMRAGNDIVAMTDAGKELAGIAIPAAQHMAALSIGK